ncbi:hypothetical protein V8V50_10335 [Ligilactobacillus salivarius]
MAVSGYYDKDDYDWREYDDYVGKRFDRWAKSQVFFGNPPLELFQKRSCNYQQMIY